LNPGVFGQPYKKGKIEEENVLPVCYTFF